MASWSSEKYVLEMIQWHSVDVCRVIESALRGFSSWICDFVRGSEELAHQTD
jgi:hypothetical protein